MNHATYVGLDVHARSTYAAAFDPRTGEITERRFGNDPGELLAWLRGLDDPACAYESGCTGFHLARFLNAHDVPCVVAATSRLQRPAADTRKKNDRRDAAFLARALAVRNVVEVFIPDVEAEAARDLARLQEDLRKDLCRARRRLDHFLLHKGHVFDARGGDGRPVRKWGRAHREWMDSLRLESGLDAETLAFYRAEVRHLEMAKARVEARIRAEAAEERWRSRVEALTLLRGVGTLSAFAFTAEAVAFSRFRGAEAYWSWAGLVPSEHISDGKGRRGPITKCGNSHVRTLLTEAAWHFAMAGSDVPKGKDSAPPRVWAHALKGNRRLSEERRHLLKDLRKHPCAANTATARELAGWVWAIGCMVEGTL